MKRKLAFYLLVVVSTVVSFAKVESYFGVCSHPFAPREKNIVESLFAKMEESKTGWLRTDFVWGLIDKNTSYDFSVYDNIVDKLAKRNVSVLGILTSGKWGGTRFVGAEECLEEWKAYIRATVTHFKGRVDHWEIINEPDHPNFLVSKDKNQGRGYGKLMKAGYEAVKEANPNAKVLFGGLCANNAEFVSEALKVVGENYDIMNFHTYPAPLPPEENILKKLNLLKDLMKKQGVERPVWLTEIGSTTPSHTADSAPIVKACIKHLGVPTTRVFALGEDTGENMKKKARAYFPKAKKIKVVKYGDLKNLRPDSILLLPTSQYFNHQYGDDIADYVRRGGTLVYPSGGYPFYFNTSSDKKNTGVLRILQKMRVDMRPHWVIDPKMPGSFKKKNYYITAEFKKSLDKTLKSAEHRLRGFDYTAKYLHDGDEFIPVYKIKWNGNEYTPVAIYKFGSDFLGNIIFVSTNESCNFITEKTQAEFLTRFYLFSVGTGIEKVFNYNFRSHGEISAYEGHFGIVRKDLSEKPAFLAFRNAVELFDCARDIKLTKDDAKGIYSMSWKTADNRDASAYWSIDYSTRKVDAKISKGAKILNHLGEEIDIAKFAKPKNGADGVSEFEVGFAPVYIVGKQ